MSSTAEWREDEKESVNWKVEQQKLTNLNDREIENNNNKQSLKKL